MTFLAALTAGTVTLVVGAANDWRSDVGREMTIQVRPVSGRDIDADVRKAVGIVRGANGVAEVRAFTKQESAQLVEPWLGAGLALDDLPIPRLIVVKLFSGAAPDFAAVRQALANEVPAASLDDHRRWIDRMRNMAGSALVGGLAVLGLVLVATVLSVTFATRGTMAANRPIIEVLHYVGATDGFIGRQFQRHFLMLGLKGGATRRRRRDPVVRRRGSRRYLARGNPRGRRGGRFVRQPVHRRFGVSGDSGADRADGGRHRLRLAPYRQPDAGGN